MSRRGRRTVVRHRNELSVPTVTHLHGGVTPPSSDGFPTDLVLPTRGWHGPRLDDPAAVVADGVKEYTYPTDQAAATLWYHDHRMDFTGPQVYRGLAGFHLVHDDEEDALPLPKGERDIPLMICDRAFDADGTFMYPSIDPSLEERPGVREAYLDGVLGDVVLVNGAPWPELDVTATRYRFRILNASNARRYKLALDPTPRDGNAFVQVGSDVGLLAAPVGHDEIEIAQAERFDVVVDFSAYRVGTRVTLVNRFGTDSTRNVMRFHVTRRAKEDSTVPARLADVEQLTRASGSVKRKFRFIKGASSTGQHAIWTVNGKAFDPRRIDARPILGSTEIWQVTSDEHHPVHLHLAHFQILRRLGEDEPRATDAGWKDTIDMPAGQVAELAVRFTGYRGRYVLHCHNLEHEDMMMMASFEVT